MSDTIKIIPFGCFHDCKSLKNIDLPSSLTKIGSGAFDSCTSLESLTLPNNLEEIGAAAFWEASSLSSIKIPKNINKLGKWIVMRNTKIEFEDTVGWQCRYVIAEAGYENIYKGDWEDISPDVMADYDSFKKIMYSLSYDGEGRVYEHEFRKV